MSETPKAPLTTTTSLWPAAIVLGTGVIMLVVFMAINIIAGQGVAPTTTTLAVVVGGLQTDPTNHVLALCDDPTNVPSNIMNAFVVPTQTHARGAGRILNAGAGDFDCSQPLWTRTSGSALLAFYQAQLETRGWSLFSHGTSNGGPESLFQRAGNDGFYWVVGITVASPSTNQSNWTFRIYQNSQTI